MLKLVQWEEIVITLRRITVLNVHKEIFQRPNNQYLLGSALYIRLPMLRNLSCLRLCLVHFIFTVALFFAFFSTCIFKQCSVFSHLQWEVYDIRQSICSYRCPRNNVLVLSPTGHMINKCLAATTVAKLGSRLFFYFFCSATEKLLKWIFEYQRTFFQNTFVLIFIYQNNFFLV